MPRKCPVIVLEQADNPDLWRYLIAGLAIAQAIDPLARPVWSAYQATHLPYGYGWFFKLALDSVGFTRGIALCFFARVLFKHRQCVRLWIFLNAGLWIAEFITKEGFVAYMIFTNTTSPFNVSWFNKTITVTRPWTGFLYNVLMAHSEMVSWLAMLVAATWRERDRNVVGKLPPLWLMLAAVWAFATGLVELLPGNMGFTQLAYFGMTLAIWPYAAFPFVIGFLLLYRSWVALPFCIVLSVARALAVFLTFKLSWLSIQNSGTGGLWPFTVLVVGIALKYAVPWIVMAWIVWRSRDCLPDDGSPFPRRYCGQCHYNLHGLEQNRCPECGTELEIVFPSTKPLALAQDAQKP